MTYLLELLAILMLHGGGDVAWREYDSVDHITLTYEQRTGLDVRAIRAFLVCDNDCTVHLTSEDYEQGMEAYLNGEEPDRNALKVVVHELLHFIDYQDDGIYNGSPLGLDDTSDFAHTYVHNVLGGHSVEYLGGLQWELVETDREPVATYKRPRALDLRPR